MVNKYKDLSNFDKGQIVLATRPRQINSKTANSHWYIQYGRAKGGPCVQYNRRDTVAKLAEKVNADFNIEVLHHSALQIFTYGVDLWG